MFVKLLIIFKTFINIYSLKEFIMHTFKILPIASIIILSLVMSFTGCSKKNEKKSGEESPVAGVINSEDGVNTGTVARTLELNGDSDSSKAGVLQTVYFPLDSADVDDSTKATLTANAAFLKLNSNIKVQVEGHCDERGGVQYNLALGEKRAKSVKDFLIALGISAKNISTISYGKERPIALDHDEAAWAKNRRANFVITAK